MKLTGTKGEIVAAAIRVGETLGALQCPEGSIPLPAGPEGRAFCEALDSLLIALISVTTRTGTPQWRKKFVERLHPYCRDPLFNAPKERTSKDRISLRK